MMLDSLRINKLVFEAILDHFQAVYPQEGCGLLAGLDGQVSHWYAVENSLHSPVAYLMEPAQQLQAMLAVEEQGLTLLGACHSHPNGPPKPSQTDIEQAYYPDFVQVIVSLQERAQPSVRGFYIVEGQVNEISLLVE